MQIYQHCINQKKSLVSTLSHLHEEVQLNLNTTDVHSHTEVSGERGPHRGTAPAGVFH